MRKKKYFGKRAMLNLPGHESIAAMCAEIEDTSTWRAGKNYSGKKIENKWMCVPNTKLNISDCTRSVELTITISSEATYENSLHKVDTMIEALSGLRMGIVTERARYVERVDALPIDAQQEDTD